MKLAEKQRVLLDRLRTFGNWLSQGKLPVEVLEVRGFGSFFRGKTKPRDVDLVIRRAGDTADFRLFSKLLDKATYGRYSREFSTPQAALLKVFDQHYSHFLPGMIDMTAQRHLFEQWIEGYSWAMLYDTTIHRHITLRSSTEIARRLMKRHLPNVNIPMWLGPKEPIEKCGLHAGFTVLVWSREKPDIQANVETALAQDQRRLTDEARWSRTLAKEFSELRKTISGKEKHEKQQTLFQEGRLGKHCYPPPSGEQAEVQAWGSSRIVTLELDTFTWNLVGLRVGERRS